MTNFTCLSSNLHNSRSFISVLLTSYSLFQACPFNFASLTVALCSCLCWMLSCWFQITCPVSWDHFELWFCPWESLWFLPCSCSRQLWQALSRTASCKLLMKVLNRTRCRTGHCSWPVLLSDDEVSRLNVQLWFFSYKKLVLLQLFLVIVNCYLHACTIQVAAAWALLC